MNSPYQFTPYMLPMLASALFEMALGLYCLRRRSVLGALPLAITMFLSLPYAVGAMLELAAVDVPTQILWVKFQEMWPLVSTTALFCFVVEYANLGRWLTRRNLALLSIPVLAQFALVLTDDLHHWMWSGFSFDGYVQPIRGMGIWIMMTYAYALTVLHVIILLWLFVRSPLHRAPVGLILLARTTTVSMFLIDAVNRNPFAPIDLGSLVSPFSFTLYLIALFRYRMFDVIPVARETVIDQMQEGMLVLDAHRHIVDLNRAAEKILGQTAPTLRGHAITQVVPASSDMRLDGSESEMSIDAGDAARTISLHLSSIKDRRGSPLGYLVLLNDVTEQKQAQQQLLKQQRVVATLEERERLARELHDTLVQATASIRMQAETANVLLTRGETVTTRDCLARLVDMAQDIHLDLREYIFEASAASAAEESFFIALRAYLEQFIQRWAIQTQLHVPAELERRGFDAAVRTQLLRIIQEALANTRKHGSAHCADVIFELEKPVFSEKTGFYRCFVEDDGCGFEPMQLAAPDARGFGIRSMRERAQAIGGTVEIQSAPGRGTRVMVRVPVRTGPSEFS